MTFYSAGDFSGKRVGHESQNKSLLFKIKSETGNIILENTGSAGDCKSPASKDVKAMLAEKDFFDLILNKNGAGFTHLYELQTIANDRVVIDLASGLMWQHGGSDSWMNFEPAQKWINILNQKGYAGFKDWRLPTLEEAMSLMEQEKNNNDLYIDPVYDAAQRWIWTARRAAWVVHFYDGSCYRNGLSYGNFVRAVRSGQASQE